MERECSGIVILNNNRKWITINNELIEIHKDFNLTIGKSYKGYIKKIKLFPREGEVVIMSSENLGELSKNVTNDRLLLEGTIIEGFASKKAIKEGERVIVNTFSIKVDMLNGTFKYIISERRNFVIKEKDYIKVFMPIM